MDIPSNIYRIMNREKITQAALASRIGITPQRLNDFLKGRRPLRASLLGPICEALTCEPNELLGWPVRYGEICVTDDSGEVIAVVAGGDVVEHEGYHVLLT